ncbi:hypothetical protein ULG90_08370 [Halopseudomonas pachastrellae]|nr:hypothetical protein ULG90_08370 [Halopseudomonas pachastrellae]
MGKRTLLDELLDAMVTHHAIADDDQRFFLDRGDERIHGQSSVTGLLFRRQQKRRLQLSPVAGAFALDSRIVLLGSGAVRRLPEQGA